MEEKITEILKKLGWEKISITQKPVLYLTAQKGTQKIFITAEKILSADQVPNNPLLFIETDKGRFHITPNSVAYFGKNGENIIQKFN